MDINTCHSCSNSYMGADEVLRCRYNALQASPALWEDCKRYNYEPGSYEPSECQYCEGRGD